ncbi:MAG: GIY-YIG nuclease family protein [Eubacteriales bacterium]|nr:GIY-YIG nuclease family protein [Eubacteriales bacterium]
MAEGNYSYILRCADDTLYCGWTNDLSHRVAAHNAGKGAKYTRARLPAELVYWESFGSKEAAMRREYELKQLTRQQKLKLIEAWQMPATDLPADEISAAAGNKEGSGMTETKHHILIKDDFDLEKIRLSGQCFRVKELSDGWYRFITGEEVLYIRKEGDAPGCYAVSCTEQAWEQTWKPYFDFPRSYTAIRRRIKKAGIGAALPEEALTFADRAVKSGRGLRILRQDPWEMMITFILSQRKSIPAIMTAVEALCRSFGRPLAEGLYAFPSPEALYQASPEALSACGLGYRAPYVRDAARRVYTGEIDPAELSGLSDEALYEALLAGYGVGKKVASCIMLFGYGRLAMVPVDVWIERAIRDGFLGQDYFPFYGKDAGVLQQYIFYYETHGEARA